MTEKESDHLPHILTAFDAPSLGEGDANAGAAVLAAAAVALANLARPGSGILTPEGRLMRVGCNLLASGPLVTDLVLSEVVTPVGRCQSRLLAQLARLLKDDATEADKVDRGLPRKWTLSSGPKASPGEQALFRLMTSGSDLPPLIGTFEDEWASVVSDAPSERLADLVRRPRSFIAALTPDQLEQQLSDAHLGQALVAIGLNRPTDAARFGELCPALMDGLLPGGPSGQTVRGRLLVTDPGDVLREVATATGDQTGWLTRLLWLVHGGAGPDFPPLPAGDDDTVRLPNLSARFEHAVRLLFANRLNSHEPQPVIYECDLSESQARWMSFLADMEQSLPGISGTARLLLASLLFSLRRLVEAARTPKDFKYYREGVEALARFLIHRMANYRAAVLYSAEEARKLRYKRKILAKLAEGRLDKRSIYHPLHLPAALCEDMLWELEADGLVKPAGRKWARVEGASLPALPPPFEV